MKALLKIASALAAACSLPQICYAESDPARLAAIAEAGTLCALSADKVGANTSRFIGNSGWVVGEDGKEVRHNAFPIVVTLPADPDGLSRICKVEATMASQSDQKEMLLALEVLLRQKPIEQADSVIWMFGKAPNARGLQFFPDYKSDRPEVRFIGAAF